MSDLRKKLLAAKLASFEKNGNATSLAGAIDDYEQAELVAEAKQWLGAELWNRFSLLGIGKEERNIRLRMISALKDSIDKLKEMEYILTDDDPEKISKSTTIFLDFSRPFLETFVKDLGPLKDLAYKRLPKPQLSPQKDNKGDEEDDGVGVSEVPPSNEESSEESPRDQFWKYINIKLDEKVSNLIGSNIENVEKEKIKVWYNNIRSDFKKGERPLEDIRKEISLLEQELDKLFYELENKLSPLIDDDIRKVAQNVITKWIKRKLMGLSPSMIDQIYLNIIDDVLELRPKFKKMVKILKDKDPSNVTELDSISDESINKIKSIKDRILMLADHMYSIQDKSPIKAKTLRSLRKLFPEIKEDSVI